MVTQISQYAIVGHWKLELTLKLLTSQHEHVTKLFLVVYFHLLNVCS